MKCGHYAKAYSEIAKLSSILQIKDIRAEIGPGRVGIPEIISR